MAPRVRLLAAFAATAVAATAVATLAGNAAAQPAPEPQPEPTAPPAPELQPEPAAPPAPVRSPEPAAAPAPAAQPAPAAPPALGQRPAKQRVPAPPADREEPPRPPPVPQAPQPDPAAQTRDIALLLRVGVDVGGDEVAEIRTDDGSDMLKAGELYTVAAGFLYHPAAPWALEATIGYKFEQTSTAIGNIGINRIPLDVIVSFASNGHRLGAGPTVHFSPTFECDPSLCTPGGSISADTAVGFILQYAYGKRIGANAGFDVGFRYTSISYSSETIKPLDGSSFGLFLGGWL